MAENWFEHHFKPTYPPSNEKERKRMNKLSKRAISIIVIATFLISMIPIMPASAAVQNLVVTGTSSWTPSGYTVTFGNLGTGVGEWTTEQALELSSVKLATGDTRGQLIFTLTTPIALSTLVSQPSFMYYDPSVNASGQWNMTGPLVQSEVPWGTPYVNIGFDKDGGSTTDAWLEGVGSSKDGDTVANDKGTEAVLPSDSTWTEMSEGWGYYTDGLKFTGLSGIGEEFFNVSTFAEWKTAILAAYSNADVTVITINFGYWQAQYMPQGPVYVDHININGTIYPLEDTAAQSADKGDTLTIHGIGLTGGAEVSAYWDFATGSRMHLLNTTFGNPDGSFDIEVDVPSDFVGDHYLWVTDAETGIPVKYGTPIFVVPKLSLSPSSGLVGDEITVKGYGFSAEVDVTIDFAGEVKTTTVETDELGYVTYKFDVPSGTDYGDYYITAADDDGWTATKTFTVGASITLDPDEGPTGSKVKIEGRGWSPLNTTTFKLDGITVKVVDDKTITVKSDGTFTAEVIIPDVASTGDYELEATESGEGGDPKAPAHDHFEVTGLPKLKVSPTYGTPGATITVKGYNFTQIAGEDVTVKIGANLLVTALTKSDGTFEDTFISPAIDFATYDVIATDEYLITADDEFKVGLIALIINPLSGESGTKISLTGIGFANGDYNVTFASSDESYTKLYEDYDTVVDEAIADPFWVPNVEPGTYTLTISDTDDNELTTTYTVTESTYVVASPVLAPNGFNVSLKGYNFGDTLLAEQTGALDFVIYNATADGKIDLEKDMDVDTDPGTVETVTNDDGNFTGYWIVLAKDILSIGDYTINVTGHKGLIVQVPFSVVAARVSVTPRKATFARGDTVSFDISNDFAIQGTIEIYAPDETLYWITDPFYDGVGETADVWVLVVGLETVPYYSQTANSNPMEIANDAPLGTWTYFFYDDDADELMNSTFVVGASAAAQVDELLDDVRDDISALAEDLAGITDDVEDDIAALSGEIGDVASDLSNLANDIVSDLAGDIAAATDAGQAALDAVEDLADSMSDLGNAVSDIADVAADSAAASQSAADAANDAVDAAQAAQDSASGLTTLVYGAIGASLIAALAAIVSLMQISKRIAG